MKFEQDLFLTLIETGFSSENKSGFKKQKVSRKKMGGTLQSQNKFPMDWNE